MSSMTRWEPLARWSPLKELEEMEKRLSEDADGSKINAEYKDGVLKIHLPKSEKAKPKAIEVKVS